MLASEKSLPMKFLLECVKHLESDLVPKFLKEVLIALVEIKGGSEKVAEMMTQSGVTIQQLLPADKVADFISRNPVSPGPEEALKIGRGGGAMC